MTRIVVYIDKLVLRDVDRNDAAAVSAGVQTELQRLLAEPGATAALTGARNRHRIKASTVQITHATSSHAMGQSIAGSILKGVSS